MNFFKARDWKSIKLLIKVQEIRVLNLRTKSEFVRFQE